MRENEHGIGKNGNRIRKHNTWITGSENGIRENENGIRDRTGRKERRQRWEGGGRRPKADTGQNSTERQEAEIGGRREAAGGCRRKIPKK